MGYINTHKNTKKSEKPLLGQILNLIPKHILINSADKFKSNKSCRTYKMYDQLVSMMFGQLNKCHSLREISIGLGSDEKLLRDIGLEQSPAKSTMSDGNEKRNWEVYQEIYTRLIKYYGNVFRKRPEYKHIKEIEGKNIKLIDASIMSVCLSLFEWAEYRTAKGGIKLHTSLDEMTMLPEIINITEAKVSDHRGVDAFRYPKDTIVVDDRGYFDFKLFVLRIEDGNILVTRMKSNTVFETIEELDLPEDTDQHILKDELIYLKGNKAKDAGLDKIKMRRVTFILEETDRKTGKTKSKAVSLISNNLTWPASVIAELYKRRWYIETFFKLMKQNLQIKNFLGTSENACKSQIFIALICYFLLELVRRTMSNIKHRFGHFVTLIRICLLRYDLLEYIVNDIRTVVKKVKKYEKKYRDDKQFVFNFG
jgi:hypothetical protein